MEQGTAQLTAVHGPRTVNTKNGPSNVWDAQFSNNIRATIWEAPLAQISTQLVNQQVDFSYTTRANTDPQFPPNHTLKAIAAAQNGGAATVIPVTVTAVAPVHHDDKSDRIERQSAYKAAVDWVGRLNTGEDSESDLWKLVQKRTDALAYYAKHGRWQDTELPVPVVVSDNVDDWV